LTARTPFAIGPDHLRISVRLTPRSAVDRIDSIVAIADREVALAVRVRAVPEDGRANAALEKLLAKALRVPRSAVSVASGHKSRLKQLRVEGDPDQLLDLARRLWPNSNDDNWREG
jgi:uncharacterized protein (TIGR00251 family)